MISGVRRSDEKISCQEEIERLLIRCSDTVLEEVRYENHFDLDRALAGADFDAVLFLREEDARQAAQVLSLRSEEQAETHSSAHVQFEPSRPLDSAASLHPPGGNKETVVAPMAAGPQLPEAPRFFQGFLQFCKEECARVIAQAAALLPESISSLLHKIRDRGETWAAMAPALVRRAVTTPAFAFAQFRERIPDNPSVLAHGNAAPATEDREEAPRPEISHEKPWRYFLQRTLAETERVDMRRLAAWALLTWFIFTFFLALAQLVDLGG